MNISTLSLHVKSKDIFHYINFYLGLLFVFLIPFGNKILPPVIGLWIISWLIEGNFRTRFSNFGKNKEVFFLLMLFYFWHVMGLIYSANQKSAMFDLEIKLSILIFPIVFSGLNSFYKEKFDYILKSFLFGNLIAAIACLGYAFIVVNFNVNLENFKDIKYFFLYTRLSIFIHPSYFAMYIVFCLAIIEYIFINKFEKKIKYKFLYYFLVAFFVFFVYLLSSRAGLISLLIICLGILIFYLIKIKIRSAKMIILSILLVLIILMIYNPRFMLFVNNNYSTSQILKGNSIANGTENTDESSNVRLQIWKSALKISAQNIILGVGTGDIKNELNKEYIKSNNNFAIKSNLNVHNQFLETFMGQGIIGLVLLLILFFIAILRSYQTKNRLLFLFAIIIGFNFLFESMLNTQAGVLFFSFFYCFLLFTNIPFHRTTNS